MTSISWESSKKQRLAQAPHYELPPRLSQATTEELEEYGKRSIKQAAPKQTLSLRGDYFKEQMSHGSFEKGLNASLLDFENSPSFLEPEINADEPQLWNTFEKTSLLALSRFPDSQSSSSSAHSTSTIVNSPASSSSHDSFGGSLEPLIPDYFPEFFLGNEELFEKKPLEDSFQSPSFDSQDSPSEQPFAIHPAESSPGKPPVLSSLSQSSPSFAKAKIQTRNLRKRAASSLAESPQMGGEINRIKIGLDSEEYCKVLEEASHASSIKDVYNKYKERLIQTSVQFSGNPLSYNAFLNHFHKWKKNKPSPISNRISRIKIDSEKLEKILEEASQAFSYLSIYNKYKESLIDSGYSWNYETFRVRVNDWKEKNGVLKQENIEIDEGSDLIGSTSETFEKILALASKPKSCQGVFNKYKKRLIRDLPPGAGKPLLRNSFSNLLNKWKENKDFLKEIRAEKNIRIGDGKSPIRLNSGDFKKLIEVASSSRQPRRIYDMHRERLIHTFGRHEGKLLTYDFFQKHIKKTKTKDS